MARQYAKFGSAAMEPSSLLQLRLEVDGKLHVPELDGLRGIAILLVLAIHFNPVNVANDDGAATKLIGTLFGAGWVGVDMFFVLSGFLITGILLHARGTPHYFINFYARRALRIFPLYYGVLIVVFGLVPLAHRLVGTPSVAAGPAQLWYWTYLSNWVGPLGYHSLGIDSLGHFWSLAVEEQFYLVWPAVVSLVGVRWLPVAAVVSVAVSAGAKQWCLAHRVDPYAIYGFTLCRVETLAIGAALAAVMAPHRARLIWIGSCLLVPITLAVVVGIAVRRHLFGNWDPVVQVLGFPCLALLFASAIGLAITAEHNGPYRRALRAPALGWLARYSYGIYVFHEIVRHALLPPLDAWTSHMRSRVFGGVAYVVVGVALSLTAAVGSYNLYERPFLKLKRLFPTHFRPALGGKN